MSTPRPKVRPYTWDRGKSSECRGVLISSGAHTAFVPVGDLRRIADRMHDVADELEAVEES